MGSDRQLRRSHSWTANSSRIGHHAGPNWIEFNVAIAGENVSLFLR
jgi:hypothetical protein